MLNPQQQEMVDIIVNRKFSKLLRVSGAGGTGKTYTLGVALELLLVKNPDMKICVIAPTHDALATLKEKMSPTLQQKLVFKTVASLLRKFAFSPEIGKKAFSSGCSENCLKYDLIVLDESSMVSEGDSLRLLSVPTPVIEMGDFAQLPAVMAKPNAFGSRPDRVEVKLTKLERNSGEIARVSTLCRDSIYYPQESCDNVTVYGSADELVQNFLTTVKGLENPTDAVFLAFTNARCQEVSRLVHKELYGDQPFAEGQWLRVGAKIPVQIPGRNVQVVAMEERELMGIPCYDLLVVNPVTGEDCIISVVDEEGEKLVQRRVALLKEAAADSPDANVRKALFAEWETIDGAFTPVSNPLCKTIHRTQGATVPFVFVDTKNVKDSKGGFKKNLLYTGYSRASVHLYTVFVPNAKPKSKGKCEYTEIRSRLGASKTHKKIISQLKNKYDLRSVAGKEAYVKCYKSLVVR